MSADQFPRIPAAPDHADPKPRSPPFTDHLSFLSMTPHSGSLLCMPPPPQRRLRKRPPVPVTRRPFQDTFCPGEIPRQRRPLVSGKVPSRDQKSFICPFSPFSACPPPEAEIPPPGLTRQPSSLLSFLFFFDRSSLFPLVADFIFEMFCLFFDLFLVRRLFDRD